ncbi:MAG TPA: hypothetical protein P5215_05640 [Bacteroidales bacterium]|nr:hypothetical protein [Bacteroidales bacterium]
MGEGVKPVFPVITSHSAIADTPKGQSMCAGMNKRIINTNTP